MTPMFPFVVDLSNQIARRFLFGRNWQYLRGQIHNIFIKRSRLLLAKRRIEFLLFSFFQVTFKNLHTCTNVARNEWNYKDCQRHPRVVLELGCFGDNSGSERCRNCVLRDTDSGARFTKRSYWVFRYGPSPIWEYRLPGIAPRGD